MAVTVLAENASFISLVGLAVEQVFHIQTEPAIIPLKMGLNQSVIEQNPIGNQLDYFHETFRSTCARLNIPVSTDAVQQVVNSGGNDLDDLMSDLIRTLQGFRASRLLRSSDGRKRRRALDSLHLRLESNQQDLQAIIPLLTKVVEKAPDAEIWAAAFELITPPAQLPAPLEELIPPETPESSVELTAFRAPTTPKTSGPLEKFTTPNKPENAPPPSYQTPTVHNTAGIVNSSETRVHFDKELQMELGTSLSIGVPGFEDAFFGGVSNLQSIANTVFEKCQQGHNPPFKQKKGGWQGWPSGAHEPKVLDWFQRIMRTFLGLAAKYHGTPRPQMKILRQSNKPLPDSVSWRKLDIGFVRNPRHRGPVQFDWSHVLVPGELKSNPKEDTHESTWLDLARYVREVFNTQESRRFVQGFTLCGSLMRLWEFDRLGGIASSAFDINKDGLRFVSTVLGYLWMTDEQLGFDPTITSNDAPRYITITKGDTTERLVIVNMIRRYSAINGRGTVCWKVHPEGDPSKRFVVKDSWQYPERDEEGEYLLKAAERGVDHVARYYHHETVRVGGKDDTIVGNVRKELDIRGAENAYKMIAKMKKEEEKKKDEDLVRSLSQLMAQTTAPALATTAPAFASTAPKENKEETPMRDRVHRRVVLRDYGQPLYKASSRVALLAALESAITGHLSLRRKADILHRDISINNVLVNEDDSTWPGFLIDLDLAIKERRLKTSGAFDKTGTKVFMAIGALAGKLHSFMHDLESFFWVLLWICIHYNGPNEPPRVVSRFENWNYMDTDQLAIMKAGIVTKHPFLTTMIEHVTPYFQPLIPWLWQLRMKVFPNGQEWEIEDEGLYEDMRKILRAAMLDPEVLAE